MREQLAALERVEFFLHGADPGAQASRLSQPFAGAFGVGVAASISAKLYRIMARMRGSGLASRPFSQAARAKGSAPDLRCA